MHKLLIGYSIVTLAWVTGILLWQMDWAGSTAPAWVQAIGSVAAVVAAIVISQYQNRHMRIQRLEEDDRRRAQVLRGLNTEMNMVLMSMQKIGGETKIAYDEGVLAFHNSYQRNVIFDSVHEMVLTVPSDDLRHNIIHFYSGVRAFVRELEIHNERVENRLKVGGASFESLRDDQRYIISLVKGLEDTKVDIEKEMHRLAII